MGKALKPIVDFFVALATSVRNWRVGRGMDAETGAPLQAQSVLEAFLQRQREEAKEMAELNRRRWEQSKKDGAALAEALERSPHQIVLDDDGTPLKFHINKETRDNWDRVILALEYREDYPLDQQWWSTPKTMFYGAPDILRFINAKNPGLFKSLTGEEFNERLPFMIDPSTLVKIYEGTSGRSVGTAHDHNLTIEDLYRLIDEIDSPLAVFRDISGNGESLIFLTQLTEKSVVNGKVYEDPVIVPIRISQSRDGGIAHYRISSAYGIGNRKRNAILDELGFNPKTALYINRKKLNAIAGNNMARFGRGGSRNQTAHGHGTWRFAHDILNKLSSARTVPDEVGLSRFAPDWATPSTPSIIDQTDPEMQGENKENYHDPAQSSAVVVERVNAEMEEVRRQYEGTERWMKAPNGEPTKLNERQWLQVRTPSFKAWFGDWENDPEHASKVVDENGEPRVVFHGSKTAGFTVFDKSRGNVHTDAPDSTYWFAQFLADARTYSGSNAIVKLGYDTVGEAIERLALVEEWHVVDEEGFSPRTGAEIFDNEERAQRVADEINDDFDDRPYRVVKMWRNVEDNGYEGDKVFASPEAALAYANEHIGETLHYLANYPVFLNLRNPMVRDFQGYAWNGQGEDEAHFGLWLPEETTFAEDGEGNPIHFSGEAEAADYAAELGLDEGDFEMQPLTLPSTNELARDALEAGLYDGLIIRNVVDAGGEWETSGPGTDYIVFDPRAIKSATDNVGSFDAANPDIRFHLNSATAKVRAATRNVTREVFAQALEEEVRRRVERLAIHIRDGRDDDGRKIVEAALRFYDLYAEKVIELSNGMCVYFAPALSEERVAELSRELGREATDVDKWVEYAIHAVTNDTSTKTQRRRSYQEQKDAGLEAIEEIVRQERIVASEKGSRDGAFVFAGKANRRVFLVVTTLDNDGNADLREVTVIPMSRDKKAPPTIPLSEAVEKRHQGAGYPPSTKTTIAQSGGDVKPRERWHDPTAGGVPEFTETPLGQELVARAFDAIVGSRVDLLLRPSRYYGSPYESGSRRPQDALLVERLNRDVDVSTPEGFAIMRRLMEMSWCMG